MTFKATTQSSTPTGSLSLLPRSPTSLSTVLASAMAPPKLRRLRLLDPLTVDVVDAVDVRRTSLVPNKVCWMTLDNVFLRNSARFALLA